jgi:hypothetical protein
MGKKAGAIALNVKSKDDSLPPKHRQAEHRLAVDEELSHGVETPKGEPAQTAGDRLLVSCGLGANARTGSPAT